MNQLSATPTVAERPPLPNREFDDHKKTARITGLWYLGLAVTGLGLSRALGSP